MEVTIKVPIVEGLIAFNYREVEFIVEDVFYSKPELLAGVIKAERGASSAAI